MKSSIIYQRGLEGEFKDQTITVELLLNVLSEINQKHKNKLYPFIGGWNIHLLKVAGEEFEKVSKFDNQIRTQLFSWINIDNYDKASYFCKFKDLASEVGSALRIFTLNYDICVEKSIRRENFPIELGFNENRQWQASRFDSNENSDVTLYLYKLHGSIDWIRTTSDKQSILKLSDSPQPKSELIFGIDKLKSIDPYLFYVHELRKYSLSEYLRFIVIIGYSFSDEYINNLISQAVSRNQFLKILVVSPEEKQKHISERLSIKDDRIECVGKTAEKFFNEDMNLSFFTEKSPGDDDPF